MFDSVFINGTVGAGKSTLADALGALQAQKGRPHAVIDLDEIRRFWPSAASDRFNHELELENLRDLARNYRRAGAERIILAGVLEQRGEVERYVAALAGAGMFICRLAVVPDVACERLTIRHANEPEEMRWHLERTVELSAILDASALDHLVLDSSSATPEQLAREVERAAGWAEA